MSTKKSLEKCIIQGKEAHIGTFVAYPKSDFGYHTKVHTGIIKRITDRGVWIEPSPEYKDDKSGKMIEVTNGEPKFITDSNGWYSSYRSNPNYKLIEKKKSLVHDWIWRECYKCLVV